MFMERPYILTAQTLADAFLLHISKQVVFESIAREPEFAKKMLAGLSTKLHGLIADVESYSLQSGTQRVIGYLLRDWVGGEDEAARYTVTLPASTSRPSIFRESCMTSPMPVSSGSIAGMCKSSIR